MDELVKRGALKHLLDGPLYWYEVHLILEQMYEYINILVVRGGRTGYGALKHLLDGPLYWYEVHSILVY